MNAKFNEIKADVNDNDARITTNTSDIIKNTNAISSNSTAISKVGLHNVTVISPPGCQSIANTTTVYQKIGNLGTFSKISDTSTVEAQFNGRLAALTITSTGVKFELRVDDTPTTNGRARSVVKAGEAGPPHDAIPSIQSAGAIGMQPSCLQQPAAGFGSRLCSDPGHLRPPLYG